MSATCKCGSTRRKSGRRGWSVSQEGKRKMKEHCILDGGIEFTVPAQSTVSRHSKVYLPILDMIEVCAWGTEKKSTLEWASTKSLDAPDAFDLWPVFQDTTRFFFAPNNVVCVKSNKASQPSQGSQSIQPFLRCEMEQNLSRKTKSCIKLMNSRH